MPLTDADRAYLGNEWRWLEDADATVKTRHPGAFETDYGSAFMTSAGAQVALDIIAALTNGANRLRVVTVKGRPTLSFKGKPPMVRVYHDRFGSDPVAGDLYMVEQAVVDWGRDRTTMYLCGAG